VDIPKGLGVLLVGKAKQASVPTWEEADLWSPKTLRLTFFAVVRLTGDEEREGTGRKGEAFYRGLTEREPGRSESSREQEVPTRPNPLGSERGARLLGWAQAAEASGQGRGGFVRKRKSGAVSGNTYWVTRRGEKL